jgi:hypothetical protein
MISTIYRVSGKNRLSAVFFMTTLLGGCCQRATCFCAGNCMNVRVKFKSLQ